MKDIELIERYLKFKEQYKESVEINELEIMAMKSLLDKNKKLEEENKELKAITQAYNSYIQDSDSETTIVIADNRYFTNGFFKENFIPKTKVKEIIENIKKTHAPEDDYAYSQIHVLRKLLK